LLQRDGEADLLVGLSNLRVGDADLAGRREGDIDLLGEGERRTGDKEQRMGETEALGRKTVLPSCMRRLYGGLSGGELSR
jgi:hypothetical protein